MASQSSFYEFEQRVRRHRPSELLPVIAETAVELFETDAFMRNRVALPWSLGAAARTSIVAGNEHRPSGVTRNDVLEICRLYNDSADPLTRHRDDDSDTIAAFLVRTGYEQFAAQQSLSEEITRPIALFERIDELETEILNQGFLSSVLGCSLLDFLDSGLIIALGSRFMRGFFDPRARELWVGPHAINTEFPMETVTEVFNRHFVASFDEIKQRTDRWRQDDPRLRRFEYNPLTSRPAVMLPDGKPLVPQPHFAFQRVSVSAIYYAATESLDRHDGDKFTRDLGVAFQDYVGRQLSLIPDVEVLPEVLYDNDQRSIDWFVIFDDLVVLVEAKTTRLPVFARMGTNSLAEDLERSIGRAFCQVARTDRLLAENHPAFASVPKERPRRGLVVTLEPYWAVNTPHVRRMLPHDSGEEIAVASIRSIEHFVCIARVEGPSVVSRLLMSPGDEWTTIERPQLPPGVERNPLLEASWERLTFDGSE